MTVEEKKVIEYWEEKLKEYKKEIEQRQNDEFKGYGTAEDIAKLKYCNLHILLNLIQTQQEVIATEDKIVEEIVNTIVGDKQLLSRICNKHIKKSEEDCEKQNLLCDDCIKMYLLNKVEKESKDE